MNLHRIAHSQRLRSLCAIAILARPVASFRVTPTTILGRRLYSAASTIDDDPLKWERMYQQGPVFNKSFVGEDAPPKDSSSQIRVVTFDLDDTIWRTGVTISAANDALASHLETLQIRQPKRVEIVMGELFQADRLRYAPVLGDEASSPVLLTLLRMDAISYVATEYNDFTMEDARFLADNAFQIWNQARHDAIASSLADSVVDCLHAISELKTLTGDRVIIGAITDGNSDPQLVEHVGKFFDFCINAETVGVGKPHPHIYKRAIDWVRQSASFASDIDALIDPDTFTVGPWWVHIGDDFVKDIVAAKDFRMRSIWSRELVLHKLLVAKNSDAPHLAEPIKSVNELDEKISLQAPVVKMQIGSGDYLTETMQKEFADRIVDNFVDIVRVLTEWHEEGIATSTSTTPDADAGLGLQINDALTTPASEMQADTPATEIKFCTVCGQKLLSHAKFCSSCGAPC
ncbi:hypothetical protein MPSEU_000567200 [Mayamaea pseudoterrestris]|nr:hypothetical protein MPSEU_000567200 [Mayamaea pseudoterrestris]